MAQERHLGTVRALDDSGDEESKKADLQRQMEEARESISNTVNEIKDTVTTQYQHVRETVSDALDWREQFRRHPMAWSVGALSVGFLMGYELADIARGQRDYGELDYEEYEESGDLSVSQQSQSGQKVGMRTPYRSTSQQTAYRPSYSSGYAPEGEQKTEDQGPGLIERFKGTRAYDRLQNEVGDLGNKFVDKLSVVGQEVILPALFAKLEKLIGMDLSSKENRTGNSGRISTQESSNLPFDQRTGPSGARPNQDDRIEAEDRKAAYRSTPEVPDHA